MAFRTVDVLGSAVRALTRALDRLGQPFMIIGGAALILRGSPRATVDIDATVRGDAVELKPLLAALAREGIVPRVKNALDLARESLVLLLRHRPSKVDVDLSLAWTGFELEALQRAQPLGRFKTPTATPEDLIVQKAIAWRAQDRQDISFLAQSYGTALDLERIRHGVRSFSDLLDMPERPAELEGLMAPWVGRRAQPRRRRRRR